MQAIAGTIKMTKAAADIQVEGLGNLSRTATKFMRQHSMEARMAVAVALETAAIQFEARSDSTVDDVPESLKPFLVHRPPGPNIIGVSEAASRLKISRTTVYDWVEKKTLLGWKSTRRGLTIPAEQILRPGKVVPGIDQVLEIIDDPELAWAFLSEEWPFAGKAARPIDMLKAGAVEEVVNGAPGFGTAFT